MATTPVIHSCRGRLVVLTMVVFGLAGCATAPVPAKKTDFIRENMAKAEPREEKRPIQTPDYSPMVEDLSPLKTRLIDITARNTPLNDVLHVIAEATGLNLLMDNSVDAGYPITLTLKRVSAENALSSIFSMLDYSYSIRDNFLVVEGITTRVYELGHPALVQSYSIDVGGDILGSATAAASGSGGGGGSSIKGGVAKTLKNDGVAFDFWDSLEKSLSGLLGKASAASRPSSTTKSSPAMQLSNPGEQQSNQGGSDTSASPEQRVTVNRLSGTIMVTASRKNQERVGSFLETVKKSMSRQVLVEARIIEVQLTDNLSYGIDWAFLDYWKGIGANVGAGFGKLDLLSGGLGNGLSDTLNETRGNFRVGTSSANFKSLLTALKTQGDVKSLSNPRISVMNGQAALLSVGKNVSFISKVSSTTTTSAGSTPLTTFDIETSSVLSGVIIGLVPFINEHGDISLTVTPIVSELINLQEVKIGQISNQTTMSLPTIDLKELSTTVKMRDGQMVIIGGLISNRDSMQEDKVPLLGDIPWLGHLFTQKKSEKSKSELVVVLQPRLVNNDSTPGN